MYNRRPIGVSELSDEQLLSVAEDIQTREKYGGQTFNQELTLAITNELKKRKLVKFNDL